MTPFPMKPPVPVPDASGEEPVMVTQICDPLSPTDRFILTGEMVMPVVEMTREEFAELYPSSVNKL